MLVCRMNVCHGPRAKALVQFHHRWTAELIMSPRLICVRVFSKRSFGVNLGLVFAGSSVALMFSQLARLRSGRQDFRCYNCNNVISERQSAQEPASRRLSRKFPCIRYRDPAQSARRQWCCSTGNPSTRNTKCCSLSALYAAPHRKRSLTRRPRRPTKSFRPAAIRDEMTRSDLRACI